MKLVICTPTKNRRWAWDMSRTCVEAQTLRPDAWIIVDNSSCPAEDWSIATTHPLVQYTRVPEPRPIGWLRNRCIELALAAGADLLAFWDDDDYYPPTRLAAGVRVLEANPTADLAGSSQMYLLLLKENVLMTTGPFGPTHATAATFVIRRSYFETHRFSDTKVRGEELEFTNEWKARLVQTPADETIVVMGHGRNTVDKSQVYQTPSVFQAKVVNADNGMMAVRVRWPRVPWDLLRQMQREVAERVPRS
jgi:glycosyltransferase involved in cell wall biosynthesis